MNVMRFFDYEGSGVTVAMIAAGVAVADFLVNRFSYALPPVITRWLPFIVAAVGAAIGDLVAVGTVCFAEETLYGVIAAYSLGTLISVFLRKIFRGEPLTDAFFALVAGLAEKVCVADENTVNAIITILNASSDFETAKRNIVDTMRPAAKDGADIAELAAVAEMILISAKRFNKEK